MSAIDGLKYYFDLLNLDEDNFHIQYNSGITANYTGTQHPEYSRSSLNFPQKINAASGMNSGDGRWTHFFVYNKTGLGQGVLFSSLQGTSLYSGYTIGLTDDNKVYFETYDNNGPFVRVGSHINGSHNAIAVSKNDSTVSFNYFDFNAQGVETESFPVQNQFILPSNSAFLGGSPSLPSYTSGANLPAVLETYAYMTEAYSEYTLNALFSGFYSYYNVVPGIVTTYSYYQTTGYSQVPTGYSGVTGYGIVYGQIGTGFNGVPISGYSRQPLSGFIIEGYNTIPLSGLFNIYSTGDPSGSLVINSGFANQFAMDRATIINPYSGNEVDVFYGQKNTGAAQYNLVADFDRVKGSFELNQIYNPSGLNLFLDGSGIYNRGFSITGNFYGSGYNIFGDYCLTGYDVFVKATGISGFNNQDTVIYDVIALGLPNPTISGTGINFNNLTGTYQRNTSRVFANNKRLMLGIDYVENSRFDFLKQRTILENNLVTIYNDDSSYFES